MNKNRNIALVVFALIILVAGLAIIPTQQAGPAVGLSVNQLYATGSAVARPSNLLKLSLTVNATAGTIIIWDSTNGENGTVLYNATKAAAATGYVTYEIDWPQPGVYAANGLYIVLGGGSQAVMVYWDE